MSNRNEETAIPTFSHIMQTPTIAFTASGILCLILSWLGVPFADIPAFLFFLLAGGGVAMALGSEVTRKGFTWGWRGLLGAMFRQPSIFIVVGVLGHMLQLAAAISIAMVWRQRRRRKE